MVQAKSVSLQHTRLFQSYKYMSIVASTVLTVLTANPTIPSFLVGALMVLEGDHWYVLLEVWINEINYTMVWYLYLCHMSTIKSIAVAVYHLESRWRNSHVLVYHGPLPIATFWEWLAIYFYYGGVYRVSYIPYGVGFQPSTVPSMDPILFGQPSLVSRLKQMSATPEV